VARRPRWRSTALLTSGIWRVGYVRRWFDLVPAFSGKNATKVSERRSCGGDGPWLTADMVTRVDCALQHSCH
jgi:hypothetical protein